MKFHSEEALPLSSRRRRLSETEHVKNKMCRQVIRSIFLLTTIILFSHPDPTWHDKREELWMWRRRLCSVSWDLRESYYKTCFSHPKTVNEPREGWRTIWYMKRVLVFWGMIKIQIQIHEHLLKDVAHTLSTILLRNWIRKWYLHWKEKQHKSKGKWQPSVWDIFAWAVKKRRDDKSSAVPSLCHNPS